LNLPLIDVVSRGDSFSIQTWRGSAKKTVSTRYRSCGINWERARLGSPRKNLAELARHGLYLARFLAVV
jgi:hypothetical protein